MSARIPPVPPRIQILQISLMVAVSLASFAVLVLPVGLNPTVETATVGDVAQTTIQAPTDIEYVSEVRTEEARKAAESAVQSVYSSPDPAIARQQIERLRTTLQNITTVRNDTQLSPEDKRSNLLALSDVRLQIETVDYILSIADSRWDAVQTESVRVLEQVMRRSISDEGIDSA